MESDYFFEKWIPALNELKRLKYVGKVLVAEYLNDFDISQNQFDTINSQFVQLRKRRNKSCNIANEKLATWLETKINITKKALNFDLTIIFYFWSEVREEDANDRLKYAFITLDSAILENPFPEENKNKCRLWYPGKAELWGTFRKVENNKIYYFTFEQGTSMLIRMVFDQRYVRKTFYKGTYIATPREQVSAGIGLFQLMEGTETEEMLKELETSENLSPIKTELHKKRFLVLDEVNYYPNEASFYTHNACQDFQQLHGSYIRYRKSVSEPLKIYGDFLQIEDFGRAVYKGAQSRNRHGRCFIQLDNDNGYDNKKHKRNPSAKNLVIELYQEPDSELKGHEFRSPHSFMMFDIQVKSNFYDGYLLRPKSGFNPNADKCIIVKVTDSTLNAVNFNHDEFTFENETDFIEGIKKLRKVHSFLKKAEDLKKILSKLSDSLKNK